MVLHQHDHGHGHGHSHDHGHDNQSNVKKFNVEEGETIERRRQWWQRKKPDVENGGRSSRKNKKDNRNINVRAAFIHVIGDLVQSIGVLIAGYIIKFFVCIVVVSQ